MTNDTSSINRTVTFADPLNSARYITASVPIQTLNDEIMDIAFVKPVSSENYPGGLDGMNKEMRFGDAVPLGKHWSYKYLIDVDGMSYSARFMAFLASDSAVVKSTVYKEYFDDWIQPWYALYYPHPTPSCPVQSSLQASLYPSFAVVQRDLQHSRVLLWTQSLGAKSC